MLILMGYLVLIALVGLYFTLREAGSIMVLAPVLGVAAGVLVPVSHLIPIGMAYELAPAFAAAPVTNREALGVLLAATSLVINAAGNALGWGVVVPLYAWAILKTRALPRWIGWLGLVVAILADWLPSVCARLERGQLGLLVRFSGVLPVSALQRDCDAAPTAGRYRHHHRRA